MRPQLPVHVLHIILLMGPPYLEGKHRRHMCWYGSGFLLVYFRAFQKRMHFLRDSGKSPYQSIIFIKTSKHSVFSLSLNTLSHTLSVLLGFFVVFPNSMPLVSFILTCFDWTVCNDDKGTLDGTRERAFHGHCHWGVHIGRKSSAVNCFLARQQLWCCGKWAQRGLSLVLISCAALSVLGADGRTARDSRLFFASYLP